MANRENCLDFTKLVETQDRPAEFKFQFENVLANLLAINLKSGKLWYQEELSRTVASAMKASDSGYQEKFIGRREVLAGPGILSDRLEQAIGDLRTTPRGHWVLVRLNGMYDAYMSDGAGGVATRSDPKFADAQPDRPHLKPNALYGNVLSRAVHQERDWIQREIIGYSVDMAAIKKGTNIEGAYVDQKPWDSVTATADVIQGGVIVECQKANRRTTQYSIGRGEIFRLFGRTIPIVVPPEFSMPPEPVDDPSPYMLGQFSPSP